MKRIQIINLATLLLTVPINMIIRSLTSVNVAAQLPDGSYSVALVNFGSSARTVITIA